MRLNERMAACQETIVSMHEGGGAAMVFTYARSEGQVGYWLHNVALGKLRVGIRDGDHIHWFNAPDDLEVHNFETGEGVRASGTVADHRITIELTPDSDLPAHAPDGGDPVARPDVQEGVALFSVTCEPAAELVLDYGALGRVSPITRRIGNWPLRDTYLMSAEIVPGGPADRVCGTQDDIAVLSAVGAMPHTVALRAHTESGIKRSAVPTVDLSGWGTSRIDGAMQPIPAYLSSALSGEGFTGAIRSPAFTLTQPKVRIRGIGWDGNSENTAGKNRYELIEAGTGAEGDEPIVLRSAPPSGGQLTWTEWDVSDLAGRSVQVRVVDGIDAPTYAWLGLNAVDAGKDYQVDFDTDDVTGWIPEGEAPTEFDAWVRTETDAPVSQIALVVGFSLDAARASQLAALAPDTIRTRTRERFALLDRSAWIKTPNADIDDTFKWSLYNMEYTWVQPYGWIECLHHWGTLFSQQHNLVADWIGQADRSRQMLEIHAANLIDGQVPQLDPAGFPRINFGGWNQFYVWGVQHYWRMTADRDYLAGINGPLTQVVDQTFRAHDPDGNGLLNFGQQIGNQEDYISTPWEGASPTMAGIEMKRIQAELARALGRPDDEIQGFTAKADAMAERLRAELWSEPLGRYVFYRDPMGLPRLDGQYHTMIWPVMFGLTNPTDSYTSMRHLDDVMTGDEGEIYVSRNFPHPVVATVGSQAGGQQQPWGMFGWAEMGDGDRAIRSMGWIARQVMGDEMQGSWPEVNALEGWDAAYFSPPAGVYAWGMIEGVFGLRLNRPEGVLDVRPCLPSAWPEATLHLPDFDLEVTQSADSRRIVCRSRDAFEHRYRVAIPPAEKIAVTLDGQPVEPTLESGVDCLFVSLSAGTTRESVVELTWDAIELTVTAPTEIAEGGPLRIDVEGLSVQGVLDPTGVLESMPVAAAAPTDRSRPSVAHQSSRIDDDGVTLQTRAEHGPQADLYGARGDVTLRRRTVFLELEASGTRFWHPVDFARVAPLAFAAPPVLTQEDATWHLDFTLQRPGGRTVDAGAVHSIALGPIRRSPTDGPDGSLRITLDTETLERLTPGLNAVSVAMNDGTRLDGRFDPAPALTDATALRKTLTAAQTHIERPADLLCTDDDWEKWHHWSAFHHPPWNGIGEPLKGLGDEPVLAPPTAPGLTFANPDGQVLLVSRHIGRPTATIPVGQRADRLYVLMLAVVDNHDTFAPFGVLRAVTDEGDAIERTLHFPGDADWMPPPTVVGAYATSLRDWNSSLAWVTPSSVFNIVELDLGDERMIDRLEVESIGHYQGLAIVGVTALGPRGAKATH